MPIVRKNGFSWCYVKKIMTSHDVMWDVFVSIIRDAKFYILCGYIHIFWSLAFVFTSMGWRVVLIDGGCCLMSSSLTPLAHIWFRMQFYFMGLVIITTWVKDKFYYDWYLVNMFLLLTIEVFGCLHELVDNFFHWCVNMVWINKSIRSFFILILCSFYKQS
jgi:hypothetical protein